MKVIVIECTAEELRANMRLGDALVDAIQSAIDSIVRRPIILPDDDEGEDDE